MDNYSDFREFMFGEGCSESFLICCDYINCIEGIRCFVFDIERYCFERFYDDHIKWWYGNDKKMKHFISMMNYEKGFDCKKDTKGYWKYFCIHFSKMYDRFNEVFGEK